MSNNSVRDQLHLLTLDDLTQQQIKSALGKTYSNQGQAEDHSNAVDLVKAHQAVHAPTYGVAIPNTHTIVEKVGDSGIIPVFTPTTNKTYTLVAASAANLGAGSMTVVFGLTDASGGFVKLSEVTPSAGGGSSFASRDPGITFDSGVYPAFQVTSGTAAQCTVSMAYAELVQ